MVYLEFFDVKKKNYLIFINKYFPSFSDDGKIEMMVMYDYEKMRDYR